MNKYRNIKTVVDGVTFDSKSEARRWQELKLLERAGEITRLERQGTYKLLINDVVVSTYKPDFRYWTTKAPIRLVVEDVKSSATAKLASFRTKRKWMRAQYNIDVEVIA